MAEIAAEPTVRNGLKYPFGRQHPEPGQAIEVAPDIHWVRMKLPFALDHINLWLLKDGDGFSLIDAGFNAPETRESWEAIIGDLFPGKPLKQLIMTHMHPDHIGLAGWFIDKYNVPLKISRTEFFQCRVLAADTNEYVPPEAIDFFRRAGYNDKQIDYYKSRFGGFGANLAPLPVNFHRIKGGDTLDINGRTWHVIEGSGHSPEHMSFYCPELKVYISGDQVLPRITSNVGVWPTEPLADSLGDWIESCHAQRTQVPDDVLVLPSHNDPFYGLHKRLDDLISGHAQNLEQLLSEIENPKRAVDVFPVLFKREVTTGLLTLATGEAIAHLNFLLHRGLASASDESDGFRYYQRTEKTVDPKVLTGGG